MKKCLFLSLSIFLLQMEATRSLDPKNCCYDKKRRDKFNWRFDEKNYRNMIRQSTWPNGIVYYDVDPHMDPVLLNYVAKAIIYMNSGGSVYEVDPIDPVVSNPDLSCIHWTEKLADPSGDKIRSWVSFFMSEGHRDYHTEADRGPKLNVPFPHSNTHIFISLVDSETVLYGHKFLNSKNEYVRIFEHDYDPGKAFLSDVLHEMLHAMGFVHEHQRRDRDCWVYVSQDLYKHRSQATAQRVITDFLYSGLFPYEMTSIMHYFALLGFYPHDKNVTFMGRQDGRLSKMDWRKVNYLYCGKDPDCEPNSTSMKDKCYADYVSYIKNPNCYKEGKKYGKPLTCSDCNARPYK